MITYQEARNKYPPQTHVGILLSAAEFAAIQLDAFKAGMTEAAKILDDAVDTHNSIGMAHREILSARDNKKEI